MPSTIGAPPEWFRSHPLRLKWDLGADLEFKVIYDPGLHFGDPIKEPGPRALQNSLSDLGRLHHEVFDRVWEMAFIQQPSPWLLGTKVKTFVRRLKGRGCRIRGSGRLAGHVHVGCGIPIALSEFDAAMAIASAPLVLLSRRQSRYFETGGCLASRGANTRVFYYGGPPLVEKAHHVEWRPLPSPLVKGKRSEWEYVDAWTETIHLGLWLYENWRRFEKSFRWNGEPISSPRVDPKSPEGWERLIRRAAELGLYEPFPSLYQCFLDVSVGETWKLRVL